MARISMVTYTNANIEQKKQYDNQIMAHGRITNMKKTLLHSVPSFKALMEWYPLRNEVVKVVGEFATNVFAYGISYQNDCLVCSTFFRKILRDNGQDPDNLVLDDTCNLLLDFAKACLQKPTKVSDELFARMKKRFNEEQIVLLTSFAGMMIATNLINSALDVELDNYLELYTKR